MIKKELANQASVKKDKDAITFQLTQEQAKFLNNSGLLPKGYSLQFLSHRQTRVRPNSKAQTYVIDPLLTPIKKVTKAQKQSSKANVQPSQNIQNLSSIGKVKKLALNSQAIDSDKKSMNKIASPQFRSDLQDEMKKCERILSKVKKFDCSWPFRQPVDIKSLHIPKYFQVIKKPMDLKTIQMKLKNEEYKNAASFNQDMQLIFQNSYKFNKKSSIYYENTVDCEQFYMNILKKQFKCGNQLKKEDGTAQQQRQKISKQRIKILIEQIKKLDKSQKLGDIIRIIYENQLIDDAVQHQIDFMKLPIRKIVEIQKFVQNEVKNKLNKTDSKKIVRKN